MKMELVQSLRGAYSVIARRAKPDCFARHCEAGKASRSNLDFDGLATGCAISGKTEIASLPAVARNDGFRRLGLAMTFSRRAQVSMEYAIIFAVALAAIFATGIIDKTRDIFKVYFTKASDSMTVVSSGAELAAVGREGAGGGEVVVGKEVPDAKGLEAAPEISGEIPASYQRKKNIFEKIAEAITNFFKRK